MATTCSSSARFQNISEDQLARTYASAEGWRPRKIKTIQHMVEKVEIQFDLSSYNKLQGKMTVLEKQIVTMREIADQIIAMNSDLDPDHNREPQEFVREFLKMVTDPSHGQDVDTLNRSSNTTGAGADPGSVIIFNVHSRPPHLEGGLPLIP